MHLDRAIENFLQNSRHKKLYQGDISSHRSRALAIDRVAPYAEQVIAPH